MRPGKRHIMAVQHNAHDEKVSLEEYFAILEKDPEHRYEYLDGDIYMMTGGSPNHSIIGGNMVRILGNLLEGRRCIVYNSDLYVELSENYRLCPDVTVSCDSRDRGAADAIRHPSSGRSPFTINRGPRPGKKVSRISLKPNHSRISTHQFRCTHH